MSLEIWLLIGALLLLAGSAYWFLRGRQRVLPSAADQRARDELDTVAGWPPEATRLLTSGERSAHETLVKALPECVIFSQVPLARFIRVARRNSYAEWLTRIGHLSADFLICDRASMVIGVVCLHREHDSARAEQRRARMTRVLKAAGVKVFVWREHAIPQPASARDQIIQRTGVPSTTVATPDAPAPQRLAAGANGKIPVAEVVAEGPGDPADLEPPSSTWFDDLDGGPAAAESARRRSDA